MIHNNFPRSFASSTRDGLMSKEDKTYIQQTIPNIVERINIDINKNTELANSAMQTALDKVSAIVFNTKEELDAWLLQSDNVASTKIGTSLLIKDMETPDYWWDGTQLQILETQKVDLSNYLTNTAYINMNKIEFTEDEELKEVISGSTVQTLFGTISKSVKTVIELFNKIGNTDISDSGNTITNAIKNISTNYLKLSGGIMTGALNSNNIQPTADIQYNLGSNTKAYNNIYGKLFQLYSDGILYGYLSAHTIGTTDTIGESILAIGNIIPSGTLGNSCGKILLYGNNTAFTSIVSGNNSAVDNVITLPSDSGTLALITDTVASATKLAETRSITLAGAVSGTLEFDGGEDKIVEVNRRHSIVGQINDITIDDPWYKFASVEISEPSEARDITFFVRRTSGVNFLEDVGILRVHVYTNNAIVYEYGVFEWFIKSETINIDDFVLAYYNDTENSAVLVELWVKCETEWSTWQFDVISEGSREYEGAYWTLYNNKSEDSKSEITPGYTQVESVVLDLSNNSATATKASQDIEGNIINSTYIKLSGGTMTGQLNSRNILPAHDSAYYIGSESHTYLNMFSGAFSLYNNTNRYGFLGLTSLGTVDNIGEGSLILGNNIASGSVGNAIGKVYLYGTGTGRTVLSPGNNSNSDIELTLPSTGGTLALTDHSHNYAGYKWNAISTGKTWSRLCHIAPAKEVVGSSFIITIGFTRVSVVANATFLITTSHDCKCIITQLSSTDYITSKFHIRCIVNSIGDLYIEIYDELNGIDTSTIQHVNCSIIPIYTGVITTYTTFTSGVTIPDEYTIAGRLFVEPGALKCDNIIAIGSTLSISDNAISLGREINTDIGLNSFAVGSHITASGAYSHAEGSYTIASGTNSHAEGYRTIASGDHSHAEGKNTIAYGECSHAEGESNDSMSNITINSTSDEIMEAWNSNKFLLAFGRISHAEGFNTLALKLASHAEGYCTLASGDHSHAEGKDTTASGGVSHAEGASTTASGIVSHAEGGYTTASGNYSHAEGQSTTASGTNSHAEGLYTTASGNNSRAEGQSTTASGTNSHAEGQSTNIKSNITTSTTSSEIETAWETSKFLLASGAYSHAEGLDTLALGKGSHAEGYCTYTKYGAFYSHAEGYCTIASGQCSHTEGSNTTASGRYSHAEGSKTIASGQCSHTEGSNTTASGVTSHAEGSSTTASGSVSHAEGGYTTAHGQYSHAEGQSTNIKSNITTSTTISEIITAWETSKFLLALGKGSHAEGLDTLALGQNSHAEGSNTIASGIFSHTLGYYTEALDYQVAIGSANDTSIATAYSLGAKAETIFVIGNGTDNSTRSNAFRVQGDGVTYAKGAYNSTGADYAEFFEWADGNPNNEDRRGYFVTFDDNNPNKIRKAKNGEYILGIISGNPCVVGNSDESWLGRYIMDDFGAFIYEEREIEVEYIDEETDEIKTKIEKVTFYKENPNYDHERAYTPRTERKEWDYVGMMGVLSVWDDSTCKPGGYCKVTDNGTATASERAVGTYRVIERVNKNIIKVVFTISY